MVIDPVCGMKVEEENSTIVAEYNDKIYHFCSEECKEVFQTDPGPYAHNAA